VLPAPLVPPLTLPPLCAAQALTTRDERFLDLSLEIEQNSSVSACMRNFSSSEPLRGDNKFFCDTCCSLQEGQALHAGTLG